MKNMETSRVQCIHSYLEELMKNLRREAIDAENHLPGPLPVRPPRTLPQLSIVLPDAPTRVHGETNVMAPLEARIERREQVAGVKMRRR